MKEPSLLLWTTEYETGFRLIDSQHIRLFQIYNNLLILQQRKEKADQVALVESFNELVNYINIHFITEEEVLKIYNYPGYEAHKKQHEAFAKKILSYQHEFSAPGILMMDTVINMIRDWITHHILDEDRKYISFIPKA